MICFLFENLKKSTLKKLFDNYKKVYFDNEIRSNINVDIDYGVVSYPKETIAEFKISSTDLKNVKTNNPANCQIIFNKDIKFNTDDLKEALLHEMTHLWQLSKNPDKFEYTNHDIEFSEKVAEIGEKFGSEIRINLTPNELSSQYIVNKTSKLLTSDLRLIVICTRTIPVLATRISGEVLADVVEFIKKDLNSLELRSSTVEEVLEDIDIDVVNAFGATRAEQHRNYKEFKEKGSFDIKYSDINKFSQEKQFELFYADKKIL